MARKILEKQDIKILKDKGYKARLFKKQYGFSIQDTYDLDSTMVFLLYERVYAFKLVAKDIVDLGWHKVTIDKDCFTLEEWIDIIITNCEEIFELSKENDDKILIAKVKDLWVIWGELSPYMWW